MLGTMAVYSSVALADKLPVKSEVTCSIRTGYRVILVYRVLSHCPRTLHFVIWDILQDWPFSKSQQQQRLSRSYCSHAPDVQIASYNG